MSAGDLDYRQMRVFLLALARFLFPDTGAGMSLATGIETAIERMEAASGPKTQLQGIRMAMRDVLEMTRDFTPRQIAEADAVPAAREAPLLSTVRARMWTMVPKILARRKIRTEIEYQSIVERLSDMGPNGLEEPQRELANRLVTEFENRARKARSDSR